MPEPGVNPSAAAGAGFRILLSVVLALLLSSGLVSAQEGIRGRLVTAADEEPVSGATVVLLDESFQIVATTESDEEGRFRFELDGPGEFTLVAEREGFANQSSATFTVREGQVRDYVMSVTVQRVGETGVAADTLDDAQLLGQAVAAACQDQFVPELHGILFGAVRDEATDLPLPGATVRVRWDGGFGQASTLEVRTDEGGAFVACKVPGNEELEIRATAASVDGESKATRVKTGNMSRVDLRVPLNDPTRPGDILGTVIDQDSGRPVADARVRIPEADRSAITNETGVFRMADIPYGDYELQVEHIAYSRQSQQIQVIGGRALQVRIRVTPQAIEVAPIVVNVRPRRWFSDMSGLYERMERGAGFILTSADIEETASRNLGDVLRHVPGVRVRHSGGAVGGSYTVQLRGAANLLGQACPPLLWIDGVKFGTDASILSEISAFELEAVEVYRGPAEVPGEFVGGDTSCGVIVAWTKRGR